MAALAFAAALAGAHLAAAEAGAGATGPATPEAPPPPNRIFEARVPEFSRAIYVQAVEELVAAFEGNTGQPLRPGPRGKVGLKVYSNSGAGLATPTDLVRGVIEALERRGFERGKMFILDATAARLRDAGFLPLLSIGGDRFEGVPVLSLDSGAYYEPDWFYDSPLPSRIDTAVGASGEPTTETPAISEADRKSFLPTPLLFDVDFWINLPGCSDHPVIGVNAALVNATLWNASNTQRFFRSPANAPAAVAEIAAIPELRDGWAFTIFSLERYQFIGGPVFNSLYTLSEPLIWLSPNPVIIDSLMRERIDQGRRLAGFRPLSEDLRLISYAEQLGLGSGNTTAIDWVRVRRSWNRIELSNHAAPAHP